MTKLLLAAFVLVAAGVGILLASCVPEVNTKRLPRVEVSFPGSEPTETPAPAVSAPALVAPPVEAKAPASDSRVLPPPTPIVSRPSTSSLPTSAAKPTLTVPHIFALLDQGKLTAEEAKRLLSGRQDPVKHQLEAKDYLLGLINARRSEAGVPPVTLGDNPAAQLHAEAAMEGCFASHWSADGLKPYMRYSLAGGYQSNGENISGLGYCFTEKDNFLAIHSIEQEMRDAMQSWMASQGHRKNILDPWHRKVNIGVAWNQYNSTLVQHFEGDYVEYSRMPSLVDGTLSFSGRTRNGAKVAEGLKVSLRYDLPPHGLSRAQLAWTYCYDTGRIVASFRPLLGGGWSYPDSSFTTSERVCTTPHAAPGDVVAPDSPAAALQAWGRAKRANESLERRQVTAPWVTASTWEVEGDAFSFAADIAEVLEKNDSGVYTVVVWGVIKGMDVIISQHSMFHELTPPDTYRPGGRR